MSGVGFFFDFFFGGLLVVSVIYIYIHHDTV